MRAAIIYWSKGGNTEKVALAVKEGLEASGVQVTFLKTAEAKNLDWFDYDLICIGFPSYQWHPPEEVDAFLKNKMSGYRQQGRVKTGSPRIAGNMRWFFAPIQVLTPALARPFLRGSMWGSSSITSDLRYWMNGMWSVNSMVPRQTALKEDWEISATAPMRKT